MRVAVLGATGLGGSHACRELLNRGHTVTGLSRSPEKLGKHKDYSPVKLDVDQASIAEIVPAFQGFDALINAYNGANNYMTFIETTRKILLAAKAAKVGYFIMIGGSGSLIIEEPYTTAADSREWWLAYRRANADSEAATEHMAERFAGAADFVRGYRKARVNLLAGKAGEEDQKMLKQVDDQVLRSDDWIPNLPLAARACFPMFEGNTSFKWTFVSPPARYWPGPRTGKYDVWIDKLPMLEKAATKSLDGNQYEGRLLKVSVADLAVAIVDEAEKQEKVGKHWSAVSEWDGDVPYPNNATI
ncbi:uncharacterized protein LTR77_010003 [Saxophila tyrrhenica]|uniref:NAD(P)-binding domain-containing protein n=1 Tax=Saxophila tyrrhenica TaxID=1690608 RepID=A0AAV9NXA2_9PEZI|nr:hypothetical protein LTR77_010003 [Saxophila tyrrhenica]